MQRRSLPLLLCLLSLFFLTSSAVAQPPIDPSVRVAQLEEQLARLTTLPAPPVDTAVAAQDVPALERRIRELEARIAEITKQLQAPDATLMSGEEQERTMEPLPLNGFYDNGYLVFTSSDGAFKYWLDGRMQLDVATYKGSENRLPTGAEVRRARVGIKATLFTNWLTEIDIDFANNAVEMKDMWAGYAGLPNSVIRVGNHKSPFGFDTLTSSKNIIFMERAYVDSWSPDRMLGVSYSHWGNHYQFSGGVFGQVGGAFNDKDSLTGGGAGSNQGYSFVGRASVAPLNEKGRVFHFGVAGANRHPDAAKLATSGADLPDRVNASRLVKFDSRPETHVSRAKFVSTGDMKYVKSVNQLGAELASVLGPVTIQAEYQRSDINRFATPVATYADHSFHGYYGQVSLFLTGERRPYSVSEGEFARVIPTRRSGAVEVGLRYSTIDLNDETSIDPITGGDAKNITLGVTWFMNVNHKILFNVTNVDNGPLAKPGKDWAPIPAGTSTAQTVIYGDTFWTIAARYQVAF